MGIDAARGEAARVAAHVDLRDVRLFALNGELHDMPNEGEGMVYKFDAALEVQHEPGEDLLIVFGNYRLDVRARSVEGSDSAEDVDMAEAVDEADGVATFTFNLNALFVVEVQPDEPFTESELDAFGQTTGQFALYPYARELVASLTARMGLPPLHMGVMRLNLESREG